MTNKFAKHVRVLSIVMYLLALAFPSYLTRDSNMAELGIVLLVVGWISVFDGVYAWLANPLLLVCFLFSKIYPVFCLFLSVAALVISADLLSVKTLGFDSARDMYFGQVKGINIGGYLWLASLSFNAIACIFDVVEYRKKQKLKTAL